MVEDGVECLAAVLRLQPDVVVLDLEMPRMHGLEVLERLRDGEPGLPVIMCSAYTERGARSTLDALALGAADYVMKPSQQSDFPPAMETLASSCCRRLRRLLRGGRWRREVGCAAEAARDPGAAETWLGAALLRARMEIVVIGVSTGGPRRWRRCCRSWRRIFRCRC